MIESRASIAPTSPPDTGASSVWKGGWFFAARSANSLVRCGEIVLMSIASSPSWAPAATPYVPNSTASTSGESTTIVMTMSERCATSRVLLERIPYERARLFHQLEEIHRLETLLVAEKDGGADVLVALVDLIEEHAARLCLTP